ncbi:MULTISPECIES: SHOCT domain-containing protein [Bacillaceae]|uniref:SHOCT domain-containing protein n=1 Tax=Halalkalibacter alkaliphilus TaxID=2917993 RepID=A0A9X2CSL2_9BACI|nr:MULTISPECIES: SHOCT domain-containing protein [Bacillaceae]MCL7747302.1 SHOCT domain-containing protein [Halalkalibacter alkaliphilus]MDT8860524.1 SHOCT domain-containing protein [Alkalihalobacillus sp. MEB130]
MMMNWGIMNIGMILYMVLVILILGSIIYGGLVLVMRLLKKNNSTVVIQDHEQDTSLEILKERFAKGNLTQNEFEQKYTFLKGKN